jgi:hypothetical protein
MKANLYILFTFLILIGCTNKSSAAKQPNETDMQTFFNDNEEINTDTQTISDNDAEEKLEPLIIGGKQYRGRLGERVQFGTSRYIPGDPVVCTIENIDKFIIVTLWVDPEDPERRSSLQNLELLHNIKELSIGGKNLDKVDFSPISLLTKLKKLEIEGNITRMPDMTNLNQLREVEVKEAALKSFEGINGISIEKLFIESPGSNSNTMQKISDMKNLNNLKNFSFMYGKIDLKGIDRFSSLEILDLLFCEPNNINSINSLNNLIYLSFNLISENPSIEFVKNMPNLYSVCFYGNLHLYNYRYHLDDYNPTQVLDVTPLAVLYKLQNIVCKNLIIKNISTLDMLDLYNNNFVGSRLYDETEKSKHFLHFEFYGE